MKGVDYAITEYSYINAERVYGERFLIFLATSSVGDRRGLGEPSRLGLVVGIPAGLGASYGGYMVNWINGQTDRFTRLVVHGGIFDTRNFFFTTDELWFIEHEFGGLPFEGSPDDPASPASLYEKWNPVANIRNWRTPTLVVHSGHDFRVDDGNGFATFTALQRLGVTSRYWIATGFWGFGGSWGLWGLWGNSGTDRVVVLRRLLYFPDETHWILSPANSAKWHEEVFKWIS
eukprot:scaffold48_cov311-Pinguiococcus_pyrenoidosus.AAC.183